MPKMTVSSALGFNIRVAVNCEVYFTAACDLRPFRPRTVKSISNHPGLRKIQLLWQSSGSAFTIYSKKLGEIIHGASIELFLYLVFVK